MERSCGYNERTKDRRMSQDTNNKKMTMVDQPSFGTRVELLSLERKKRQSKERALEARTKFYGRKKKKKNCKLNTVDHALTKIT